MEAKTRVLAVEDELTIATHVGENLHSLGYDVPAFASSAEEAYLAASVMRPDVVLMDVDLDGPDDGITAAGKIYSELHIPVVFLTAHADVPTLRRAQEANAFGYMSKPVVRVDLMNSIETALQRSRKHDSLKIREAWLEAQLKGVGDGLIAASHDGAIWFINPEGERLLGVSASKVVGLPFTTAVPLRNRRTGRPVEDLIRLAFLQGATTDIGQEYVVDGPVSRRIGGEVAISRFGGEPIGVVFTFRDISVESYRTDTLANKLVNVGSQHCERHSVNLREAFADAEPKLREKLAQETKFSMVVEPATYRITGNQGLVESLLIELVENAKEKLCGSGSIHISAANLEFERREMDGTISRYVRLRVVFRRRIAPAESSDRERSHYGMRIDFSMARLQQALQTLRANAHEELTPGVTCWNIDIPASDLAVRVGKDGLSATIVLIEPDASVRTALCESYLAMENVECLGARDGAEALDWARMFPGQIDVVIVPEAAYSTDIQTLCEESPATRILLLTKNSKENGNLLGESGMASAAVDHLCSQDVLRNAVAQLLFNRGARRTALDLDSRCS